MIHPSYVELMEVVNEGVDVGDEPVINSRYSIVSATAKRARQLIDNPDSVLLPNENGKKPLSIAVDELYSGKLKILTEDEARVEQAKQDAYDEKMRLKREEEAARKKAEEEAKALLRAKEEELDDAINAELDDSDIEDSDEIDALDDEDLIDDEEDSDSDDGADSEE